MLPEVRYVCPACKSAENISIDVIVSVRLHQNDTDDNVQTEYEGGDHEWGGDSNASCTCGFSGSIIAFDTYVDYRVVSGDQWADFTAGIACYARSVEIDKKSVMQHVIRNTGAVIAEVVYPLGSTHAPAEEYRIYPDRV